jgi:hypothetical protein
LTTQVCDLITACDLETPMARPEWAGISDAAKDLVRGLLRPRAEEVKARLCPARRSPLPRDRSSVAPSGAAANGRIGCQRLHRLPAAAHRLPTFATAANFHNGCQLPQRLPSSATAANGRNGCQRAVAAAAVG